MERYTMEQFFGYLKALERRRRRQSSVMSEEDFLEEHGIR